MGTWNYLWHFIFSLFLCTEVVTALTEGRKEMIAPPEPHMDGSVSTDGRAPPATHSPGATVAEPSTKTPHSLLDTPLVSHSTIRIVDGEERTEITSTWDGSSLGVSAGRDGVSPAIPTTIPTSMGTVNGSASSPPLSPSSAGTAHSSSSPSGSTAATPSPQQSSTTEEHLVTTSHPPTAPVLSTLSSTAGITSRQSAAVTAEVVTHSPSPTTHGTNPAAPISSPSPTTHSTNPAAPISSPSPTTHSTNPAAPISSPSPTTHSTNPAAPISSPSPTTHSTNPAAPISSPSPTSHITKTSFSSTLGTITETSASRPTSTPLTQDQATLPSTGSPSPSTTMASIGDSATTPPGEGERPTTIQGSGTTTDPSAKTSHSLPVTSSTTPSTTNLSISTSVNPSVTGTCSPITLSIQLEKVTSTEIQFSWKPQGGTGDSPYTVSLHGKSGDVKRILNETSTSFKNLLSGCQYQISVDVSTCSKNVSASLTVQTAAEVYSGTTRIINKEFKTEYQDKSSKEFKDFEALFIAEITKHLPEDLKNKTKMRIVINSIKNGSVVVNYDIVLDVGHNITNPEIPDAFTRALNMSTELEIDLPNTVIEARNSCQPQLNDCSQHATCTAEGATYSCQCNEGFRDNSPQVPGRDCQQDLPSQLTTTVLPQNGKTGFTELTTTAPPQNETTGFPGSTTTVSPQNGTTGFTGSTTTVSPQNGKTGFTELTTTAPPQNETTGFTGSTTTVSPQNETTGLTGSTTTVAPQNETIGFTGSTTTVAPQNETIGFTELTTTVAPQNETTGLTGSTTTVPPQNETTGLTGSTTTVPRPNETTGFAELTTTVSPQNETTGFTELTTTVSPLNETTGFTELTTTVSPLNETTGFTELTTTAPQQNETTRFTGSTTTAPPPNGTTGFTEPTTTAPPPNGTTGLTGSTTTVPPSNGTTGFTELTTTVRPQNETTGLTGSTSDSSFTPTFTSAPCMPVSIEVQNVTGEGIELSWTGGSTGSLYHISLMDGNQIKKMTTEDTKAVFKNLLPGHVYTISVAVSACAGNNQSSVTVRTDPSSCFNRTEFCLPADTGCSDLKDIVCSDNQAFACIVLLKTQAFNNTLYNSDSEDYKAMSERIKRDVVREMRIELQDDRFDIVVLGFRHGSVIVDFISLLPKEEPINVDVLQTHLSQVLQRNFGDQIQLAVQPLSDQSSPDNSYSWRVAVIVLGVLLGVALVLILLAILFYIYMSRRSGKYLVEPTGLMGTFVYKNL